MSLQLLTVQQHILEEQRRHYPDASGEFSWLLSGITLATKIVAAQVRRAGLAGILGVTRETNVQGEAVQKLDVIANQTLLQFLGNRGNVAIMASEENEDPVIVERDRKRGKYVVVFDPLDGSSNIDVNVSVGTIFSVLRREPDPTGTRDVLADVLQPGYRQVAAGYVVYGSSTMLVYSAGNGVHGFTLDPSIGAYLMSHENMRMPDRRARSIPATRPTAESFPPAYQKYLHHLRSGAAGPDLFVALHRLARRRFSPHAAQRRHLPLSADEVAPQGQAAPALRSQPDRLPRRASRRHGHRRQAAFSTSSPPACTSARR